MSATPNRLLTNEPTAADLRLWSRSAGRRYRERDGRSPSGGCFAADMAALGAGSPLNGHTAPGRSERNLTRLYAAAVKVKTQSIRLTPR
jgi:hypothetical protein